MQPAIRRRRRAVPVSCVAAALVAAVAAGCGTSDDRARAGDVVAAFYRAVDAGDGRVACSLLSTPTAQQLESDEQKPCPKAVTDLDLHDARVDATAVYITNAKVDLSSGDSAFLSHEHDGWRISALGCQPSAKPADRPFDCEVES